MLWRLRKFGKIKILRSLAYSLYRILYLGRTVTVGNGPIKGMKWAYKDGQQFWLPRANFVVEAQNANSHLSSITILHAETNKAEEFEVQTITLDSLVEKVGRTPNVIKLDVEGAENLVIYGATHLIARKTTRWIISTHSAVLKSEICDIFTTNGYRVSELSGFDHEILCVPNP